MTQKATSALFCLIFLTAISLPAMGKKGSKKPDGGVVFAQHCSKCHQGGGNIVKDKKPLAGSKQLANIIVFKAYLASPPGHMPYFQDIVGDKKTLEALYNFCKNLKEKPLEQAYAIVD